MNAVIGIYDNHELAVEAVIELKDQGYPAEHLSIMGLTETEVVDKENHVLPENTIKKGGLEGGVAIGTALGVLTGVGLFAIPGLGILCGAGALVGAFAGFDAGLIGGGIVSALTSIGVNKDVAKKYHDALAAGKFLVVVHGHKSDVDKAQSMLHEHGTHTELDAH
jgi:hypothetical protein